MHKWVSHALLQKDVVGFHAPVLVGCTDDSKADHVEKAAFVAVLVLVVLEWMNDIAFLIPDVRRKC